VCPCACVPVCMCACVPVCICACVHVCMCACVHVCLCACVWLWIGLGLCVRGVSVQLIVHSVVVHQCTVNGVHLCTVKCVHWYNNGMTCVDVCGSVQHVCVCLCVFGSLCRCVCAVSTHVCRRHEMTRYSCIVMTHTQTHTHTRTHTSTQTGTHARDNTILLHVAWDTHTHTHSHTCT